MHSVDRQALWLVHMSSRFSDFLMEFAFDWQPLGYNLKGIDQLEKGWVERGSIR